ASGLANFLRMLGGGFGAAIRISIWDHRQALHDTQLTAAASTPDAFNHAFFGLLGELGLSAQASAVQLAHLISRQAFMLATNDFFWLSGWLFLALMVLVWAAKGPFGRTAGAS